MNVHSEMRDPYQALGVAPEASAEEIKRAYRALAKKYHPDRTGGDKSKEKRFKEISVAYDVLSDPEKRAKYDAMQNGGAMPGSFDLGDLFAQFFGGAQGKSGSAGGSHFRVYQNGGGFSTFGASDPFDAFGHSRARTRPPQGRGREKKPASRQVKAADGSTLTQKGNHTYSELRISFDRAMLGTSEKVATVSGISSVKIPAGTCSGAKLRLRGKGARGGSKTGDHFITIHIDIPKVSGEESQKLLAKLKKSIEKERK